MLSTMRASFDNMRSDTFLLAWNLSLAATVILPLLIFGIARATNDYEGDDDGQEENRYDEYGNLLKNHWWQFWRKSDGENQQDGDEEGRAPWWWIFSWSEEQEPEQEGQGTLVFVYLWTIAMVIAMAFYGGRMLERGNPEAFRFTLLGFANYAFICCVLIGGLGVIEVDGREMEESGWYGQVSVLVFLTCLFGLVKGLVFSLWMGKRIKDAWEDDKREQFLDHGEKPEEPATSAAVPV